MAEYDWAKATEETAKAVQGGTELAKSFGSYAGAIAHSTVETFFGIIDDRLRYVRGVQSINLYKKALTRLEGAGLDTSQLRPPTPAIEIPLLTAASNEDRDELVDLWERLLAAAIAPVSRERIRQRHIEIVKAMEPLDARILNNFGKLQNGSLSLPESVLSPDGTYTMIRSRGDLFVQHVHDVLFVDTDEVTVSVHSLVSLNLLVQASPGDIPRLTALGRNFLSVVQATPR